MRAGAGRGRQRWGGEDRRRGVCVRWWQSDSVFTLSQPRLEPRGDKKKKKKPSDPDWGCLHLSPLEPTKQWSSSFIALIRGSNTGYQTCKNSFHIKDFWWPFNDLFRFPVHSRHCCLGTAFQWKISCVSPQTFSAPWWETWWTILLTWAGCLFPWFSMLSPAFQFSEHSEASTDFSLLKRLSRLLPAQDSLWELFC